MSKKGGKISRYLKAPLKFLMKAKDFYVKSMTELPDRMSFGLAMGCPAVQLNTFPRSYSLNSTRHHATDNDLKQLVRAASTSRLRSKVDPLDNLITVQQARQSSSKTRSHYVRIGRIDEDMPCEFEEDGFKFKTDVFPRSRSYAVTNTKGAFN